MLHALRQSVHRTGRLLLPLLLLSWLSVVCGHCLALAGEFEAAPAPHHGSADTGHDCCPPSADPCAGGDCEHHADVQATASPIQAGDHTPLAPSITVAPLPRLVMASTSAPPVSASPDPSVPLYLRNCVFLI